MVSLSVYIPAAYLDLGSGGRTSAGKLRFSKVDHNQLYYNFTALNEAF